MRYFFLFIGFFLLALPEHAAAERLKLASWNFGFLTEKDGEGCYPREAADYRALQRYVAQLDADIIAFQEVENKKAAERVFNPALYDIIISKGPEAPEPPVACYGETEQFLTAQKVGFAIRRGINDKLGISIKQMGDVDALVFDEGSGRKTRPGVEIAFDYNGSPFHLLSVHLKSGCNNDRLPSKKSACKTLWQQARVLENWIDELADKGHRAIVLGDFNRRMKTPGDAFWAELDDSSPPNADLEIAGAKSPAYCGPFDEFIDFIIVDKGADHLVDENSFRVIRFDEPWHEIPADHCAVAVTLELDTALTEGFRWVERSAEYQALARQAYALAEERLDELLKDREDPDKPWVVSLDVDETLVWNRGIERAGQLQNRPYSSCRFEDWVEQQQDWMRDNAYKPRAVPGAVAFVDAVVAKGGKVVLITNRPAAEAEKCRKPDEVGDPLDDLNDDTRATMKQIGIDHGPDRLCVLGRTAADGDAVGKDGFRNDKDRRRKLVRDGKAEACWSGLPDEAAASESWARPHELVISVGDNVQDYDGFKQTELQSDPAPLMEALGDRFFLIPNPLYGSWH